MTVTATLRAQELIEALSVRHGPLVFHQSGGCCDGSAPMCLPREELPPGRYDTLLGELCGAPFYIDSELYERLGRPSFEIDVAPGAGEGFSLEGRDAVHFTSRAPRA